MISTKKLVLSVLLSACFVVSQQGPSWAQTCIHKHASAARRPHSCPSCEKSKELKRAGYPNQISGLATYFRGRGYAGYYVGGSTPFRRAGTKRSAEQGVWGWDYWGHKFQRHIALRWLNGSDAKRKFGQYTTDGPKLTEKLHGE